jgi:hypothetical protein
LKAQPFRTQAVPPAYRTERTFGEIERNKPERIIYAQHVEGDGKLLFEEICNNDLEGIVAKRKHGIYKSNSIGWLNTAKWRQPTTNFFWWFPCRTVEFWIDSCCLIR